MQAVYIATSPRWQLPISAVQPPNKAQYRLTLLLFASSMVPRMDVDNTIGINVKGHLDLWHTTRSWGNTDQLKSPERFVVFGHLPFSLADYDLHRRLAISSCREDLWTINQIGYPLNYQFQKILYYAAWFSPHLNNCANNYMQLIPYFLLP